EIAQTAQILVAEKTVIIESHLCVERHKFSITGKYARIDFEQRGIGIHKRTVQRLEKRGGIVGDIARESEAECEFARLIRLQSHRRVNNFLDDGIRICLGDFLDFHAACGAGHEYDATHAAIDEQRK